LARPDEHLEKIKNRSDVLLTPALLEIVGCGLSRGNGLDGEGKDISGH